MCDYSLHAIASRPAKVGDKLVTSSFDRSTTRGFVAPREPGMAVCLLPGTEIAFEKDVKLYRKLFWRRKVRHRTAQFCKINADRLDAHHDALKFPDGEIVLVTNLVTGQRARVLQLPVEAGLQRQQTASVIGRAAVEAELSRPSHMVGGVVPRRDPRARV